MQARIGAIAQLYDLISQSSRGRTVAVDAYLREIAKTMSASLLGNTSGIEIEVKAEPLEIDPDRAVPFGLLVNELATNAIKHAFPDGSGHIMLCVEQIGDQIELIVSDDGVGMKDKGFGEESGETRLRLRGDLRAPAWRHHRPVEAGSNRNDRQNTACPCFWSRPAAPSRWRRSHLQGRPGMKSSVPVSVRFASLAD